MMNPIHTSGPWYYVSGQVWTTPDGPHDGQCIAMRASYAEIAPWEKDANLRLCSAAPDLLEACKTVLLRLDLEAQEQGENAIFLCAALRENLRTAIAKATAK